MGNWTIWIMRIPFLLLAFSFHEFSHGYVAYRLGDPTAKLSGRLTLNPAAHMDPIGTLMLIVGGFGWARPVPFDTRYFKNKKLDVALVALAGPLSNILLAFFLATLTVIASKYLSISGAFAETFFTFMMVGIGMNAGLAAFNLIPIPPLDGSKILNVILPTRWYYTILQYERYSMPILIILIVAGVLDGVITPLATVIIQSMFAVLNLILP